MNKLLLVGIRADRASFMYPHHRNSARMMSNKAQRLRCECGDLHCHWCGRELILTELGHPRGYSYGIPEAKRVGLMSRDHYPARANVKAGTAYGRGQHWLVGSCVQCNHKRGEDDSWEPFHATGFAGLWPGQHPKRQDERVPSTQGAEEAT